jgi:hypothetical protein
MNLHRIDHACDVVRIHVETLSYSLRRPAGPLLALDDAIKTGGFIHPMTMDASRLRQAIREMRDLANEVETRLLALQENEKATRLQAAD